MPEDNVFTLYTFLSACVLVFFLVKLFIAIGTKENRRSFSATLLEEGKGELTFTVQFLDYCPQARGNNPKCRGCTKRDPHLSRFIFIGGIGQIGWSDILSGFTIGDLPVLWDMLCKESTGYSFYQIIFMSELATIMRGYGMKPKNPKGFILLNDNVVGRIWVEG